MNNINAQNAINKIHEFDKFGSILGLERMNILLEYLGNPEKDLKVIHVAGTNGKGSICKYIYEVMQAAGYKTGLYTSPFIEIFNERIEYNGAYISDDDLAKYTKIVLDKVSEIVESGKDTPTEFEVVTAIAILYFKEKKCDYVVLEVGLGGRGDSTNVCEKPLACVIASISFDHTERLGNTLAKIAWEKAGIIKEKCPIISSAESPEALKVIRDIADQKNALFYGTSGTAYTINKEKIDGYMFSANILGKTFDNLEISMIGEHQIKNAIAALTALVLLWKENSIVLNEKDIYNGFKKAFQKGRFEVISKDPYIILDGAHNPDGANALKKTIENHFKNKKILMVVGILRDKDIEGMLDVFTEITQDFILTEPNNTRKMTAKDLGICLRKRGAKCTECNTPKQAVNLALKRKKSYDLVIFAGSLYLIGELRGMLINEKNNEKSDTVL